MGHFTSGVSWQICLGQESKPSISCQPFIWFTHMLFFEMCQMPHSFHRSFGLIRSSCVHLVLMKTVETWTRYHQGRIHGYPSRVRWAGALSGHFIRSLYHLGRSSEAKDRKNPKKVKCDGPTDRPTDRLNNGPTKRDVESRSTRLKIDHHCNHDI